jgi:hypothetical protein
MDVLLISAILAYCLSFSEAAEVRAAAAWMPQGHRSGMRFQQGLTHAISAANWLQLYSSATSKKQQGITVGMSSVYRSHERPS